MVSARSERFCQSNQRHVSVNVVSPLQWQEYAQLAFLTPVKKGQTIVRGYRPSLPARFRGRLRVGR
jgi:hypothetical protein